MATHLTKQLSKLVALGAFDFASVEVSRHPMGLVTHDEIPFCRGPNLLLKITVASEHVQAGNQEIMIVEDVARARRRDHVVSKNIEF